MPPKLPRHKCFSLPYHIDPLAMLVCSQWVNATRVVLCGNGRMATQGLHRMHYTGKLYSQQLVKSHHKLPTLSSLATCSGPATNKNFLTTNQYAACQLRHLCVRTIVWLLCALITILSSTIRPIHTSSAAAL